MMIDTFLALNKVETDELGRLVIKDLALLEKINGAITGSSEFMPSDVGCGNQNCAC